LVVQVLFPDRTPDSLVHEKAVSWHIVEEATAETYFNAKKLLETHT